METSDNELLAEYLSGSDEALHVLIKRYLKPIYHFTYRLCGNKGDAEDITQETFIKLWQHAEKFHLKENFKTWIFTIAHRSTIDLLRKKKRFVFSDFDQDSTNSTFADSLADEEPLPDILFAKAEEKVLLESLVQQLPTMHREVLHLYYSELLTFDEIGKVLGKSLNTVKSQHRRALLTLKKLLTEIENKNAT